MNNLKNLIERALQDGTKYMFFVKENETHEFYQSKVKEAQEILDLFDNFCNVDVYKNDNEEEIGIKIEFAKGNDENVL